MTTEQFLKKYWSRDMDAHESIPPGFGHICHLLVRQCKGPNVPPVKEKGQGKTISKPAQGGRNKAGTGWGDGIQRGESNQKEITVHFIIMVYIFKNFKGTYLLSHLKYSRLKTHKQTNYNSKSYPSLLRLRADFSWKSLLLPSPGDW